MRAAGIVAIVVSVLVVIGVSVLLAILLTGGDNAPINLGSAQVVDEDIEFEELWLKQEGEMLILTGRYSNMSKYNGEVTISVRANTQSSSSIVSFTVAVQKDTSETFTEREPFSGQISDPEIASARFSYDDSYYENGSYDDVSPSPWEDDSWYEDTSEGFYDDSIEYEEEPEEYYEESEYPYTSSPSPTPR